MNRLQKTTGMLAILAAVSGMAYAESVDVKVIGTITPAGCKFTLSDGGTIDYGNIQANTLKNDAFTFLDEKQIDISVTCAAPTKLAVTAKSGRGQSAVNADGSLAVIATTQPLFGQATVSAAGLGLHENKGIGGYGLRLANGTFMADGNNVTNLMSDGNTTTWIADNVTGSLFNTETTTRYESWASAGTVTPVAVSSLTGKLGVQAYINKASELDLSKPVKLDGLTTLEIVYL